MNCFQKAGISSEAQDYAENDLEDPFKVLEDALQDLNAQHHDLLPSDVTAETFVDFDVDVSVTLPTPSTDEEILQAVRSDESISDDEDRENEVGRYDLSFKHQILPNQPRSEIIVYIAYISLGSIKLFFDIKIGS